MFATVSATTNVFARKRGASLDLAFFSIACSFWKTLLMSVAQSCISPQECSTEALAYL
jgi:hypothetical protein